MELAGGNNVCLPPSPEGFAVFIKPNFRPETLKMRAAFVKLHYCICHKRETVVLKDLIGRD